MGLDHVELVVAVEKRFGVSISDVEAQQAETPSKLADVVFSKAGNRWTREQVWQMMRHIIIETTGQTDFTEDSHFVNDMKLD